MGDRMRRLDHRCNGQELGQPSGGGEEQGGQECYRPWGVKESDVTEQLNNQKILTPSGSVYPCTTFSLI